MEVVQHIKKKARFIKRKGPPRGTTNLVQTQEGVAQAARDVAVRPPLRPLQLSRLQPCKRGLGFSSGQ